MMNINELKPMNDFERVCLEKVRNLQAQGKNPHGMLRDILIEMSSRDEKNS